MWHKGKELKRLLTVMKKLLSVVVTAIAACVGVLIFIGSFFSQNQSVRVPVVIFENAQGQKTLITENSHPKLFKDLALAQKVPDCKKLQEQLRTADCKRQTAELAAAETLKEPLGGKYFLAGVACNTPDFIDKAEELYGSGL
jgi:hypothetical protein